MNEECQVLLKPNSQLGASCVASLYNAATLSPVRLCRGETRGISIVRDQTENLSLGRRLLCMSCIVRGRCSGLVIQR